MMAEETGAAADDTIPIFGQGGCQIGKLPLSMIGLFAFYAITAKNATGIGWVNSKGLVLICVGVLYIVCGTILMFMGR